ncbi:hypothetical protein D9V28_06730 [Mycetocola zhadangensis]|uniref:Uncharacterized protein n=1 Tax=Mycetocola zhadangensis TaxID=1164595 RepID=A0A3L7J0H7_9MICO|nr:hypothetical protein D9V28_06730 [Mycetocola zhadangensis]
MTSLVLAILGVIAAVVVLLIFAGWAALSLLTGAPMHVLASIGKMCAIAAASTVIPLAAPALTLGVVWLARSRGWTPRPRGHGLAVSGVVISAIALASLLLTAPFWGVEVCTRLVC